MATASWHMRLIYIGYLRLRRWQLIALVILLAKIGLVIGLLASVAEAQEERRWQVLPAIVFYEQYTDNVDLTYTDQVSAFKTELAPSLSFVYPTPRRQYKLDVNLKLDHRLRSDNIDETLYWYGFWGYVGHQYSPRTSYELSTSYDVTYTETGLKSPFVNVFSALTRADIFAIRPGISYNLTKSTNIKGGLSYTMARYEEEDALDGDEIGGSIYLSQRVGSRITVGTGYSYTDKTYSNKTGYEEQEIPINLSMDLTYVKLDLRTTYAIRSFEERVGQADQKKFLWGIGFELGGQLLRLKATTVEIDYDNNFYDDIYGYTYINQELRVALFHAFKKFDFYADVRYGKDDYVDKEDTTQYYGGNSSLRWYLSDKVFANFSLNYTSYTYDPEGYDFDIIKGTVDINYQVYDWLFVGLGYGHRNSSGNTEEGNYTENTYSVFARAQW